jgi:predicted lipoprotein with Yx(FWY)xxD motif
MPVALLAGFALAALAGIAVAKSFTLTVAKNAKVVSVNGSVKHENIAVNGKGLAVYWLTGNNKKNCTKASGCYTFWPPVTVKAGQKLSAAPGIKGKLGTDKRDGVTFLTLGGHDLYRYVGDSQKDQATGQGIKSFGGTWFVITASGSSSSSHSTPSSTGSTSTTTTSPGYY